MAKLVFAYPIEEVHGKIKNGFGAAQRRAKNNEGERKPYSVCFGIRSTKPSTAEQARWASFGTIAAAVATRMKNPQKMTADMAAAKAAGMTHRAYVWQEVKAEAED